MGKAKARPETADQRRTRQIAHILAEVATGRPVTSVLAEDQGMPSKSEFWRWHLDDENLRGNLADARANGIEALMEDARQIAATPMIGEEITIERDPEHQADLDDGAEVIRDDGNPYEGMIVKVKKGDMLGHRKLLIETIHKQAQMLKPKTYGPKLDLTSGGEKIALSAEIEAARRRVADEGKSQ